jgi:hypothetical protein
MVWRVSNSHDIMYDQDTGVIENSKASQGCIFHVILQLMILVQWRALWYSYMIHADF